MTRKELQSLCDNAKAWEAEMERKYGRRKSGKSDACIMVLELMDTDEYDCNYCGALDAVLTAFPEVSRDELEKELNKYI